MFQKGKGSRRAEMERAHRQRRALEEKAATLKAGKRPGHHHAGDEPRHNPSVPSPLYSPNKAKSGGLFLAARHDQRGRGPEETPLEKACRRLKDDDTDERVNALAGLPLDAVGAAKLAEAAKKNITMVRLDLTGCSLGPAGAAALSGAMLARNTRLELLDLSDNASLGPQGVRALCGGLAANERLRELRLDRCRATDEGGDVLALAALGDALRANGARNGGTLRALHLGGNCLTDYGERPEGLRMLLRACVRHPALTELGLADNALGAAGGKLVADELLAPWYAAARRRAAAAAFAAEAARCGTSVAVVVANNAR